MACSAGYVGEEGVNPGPVQLAQHLLNLAGPLTPQAMGRIEEALNTPIGELPAKV